MPRADPTRLRTALALAFGIVQVFAWGAPCAEPPIVDAHARAVLAAAECVGLAQPTGWSVNAAAHILYPRRIEAARLDLSPWFIEDRRPVPSWQENASEAMAYDFVLATAQRLPMDSLARAARHDLTFAHFFGEPDKYRGEIVHVEGTLKRLRRFDPDRLTRKEGVRNLYEGWLFNSQLHGSNPICIVVTETPSELQTGEALNVPVAFDGFFFKRYRYEAGGQWRDAPLLIGRQPVVIPAPLTPVAEGVSNNTQLVLLFLVVLVGTLFFALFLAWWYHRGDRRVRERLRPMCQVPFVDPSES